ncbi:alanine racemase [Sulfurimonas sp.]
MPYITLNKNNFFNNLDIIAKQTKSKDKIALVLKDNAYGHGLCEMAKLAREYGITKAVVRSQAEAKEIYEYFEYILVLSEIPATADKKICFTINDVTQIEKFPKNTRVELKVNSGMNRNGIEMDELSLAFELIQKHALRVEAVFTHHSCADELISLYALQKKNFSFVKQEAKNLAQEYNITNLRFHECNSAALFREEKFSDDMARVGIAAYGCLELPFTNSALTQLKPVLSLYANRISSRKLDKDDFVGYGASYKADEANIVSNYDYGYGDGFLRACSNSYVTPHGVTIAGRISMDNSSFLTNKEELLIFNDARSVAKYARTISYEVLTSLKSHIHREVT